MSNSAIRILFVCLGNICRSPSAEGTFRDLTERRNLSNRFELDSAGTGSWHIGSPPDSRAQQAAMLRCIDLSDLRGRQLKKQDGERFDYVIGMDHENIRNIKALLPKKHHHKVHLMGAFLDEPNVPVVPDPYFGGDDGFETVLDMLQQASMGLINHALASTPISDQPPQ